MNAIDRRIVNMQFDNKDFQKNAGDTVDVLDDLKKALNFEGAADGLSDVEEKVSRFSLQGITDSIKNAVDNFPILGAVGFAAINHLTGAALSFGTAMLNGIIKPLTEGGWKRAMNLEQAQFQLEGLGVAWSEIKPHILAAVQGTAYGLDEAAKAASQLAASQVPMDKMTESLRAISGVAAMTSSGYSDIADVFTKVAGQGRVMADDLNRLSARGLNAAAVLAEHFGVTEEAVREMVSEGKVGFAEFAAAMDNAFGEHATKANETYTGALSNMNAALARIGAEPAMIKMESHRRLFNALTPAIDQVAAALTPLWKLLASRSARSTSGLISVLQRVQEMFAGDLTAGMKHFTKGLRNIFTFFDKLSDTASKAWQKVFPATGEASTFFTKLGKGFESLTSILKNTDGLMKVVGWTLEKIFTGLSWVLTALSVGFQAVGGAIGWVAEKAQILWTALAPVREEISKFLSSITLGSGAGGDAGVIMDSLRAALVQLKDMALIPINAVMDRLIPAFQAFSDAASNGQNRVKAFFGAFDGLGGEIVEAMSGVGDFGQKIMDFFSAVGSAINNWYQGIRPEMDRVGGLFRDFFFGLGDSLVGLTQGDLLSAVNTGVFAAIGVAIAGVIKDIRGIINPITGFLEEFGASLTGTSETIVGYLDQVKNALRAFTTDLYAGAILKIAAAIALLAGAFWVMSKIDSEGLGATTAAMLVLMAGVTGIMVALSKMQGVMGAVKLPVLAASMILVGAALLVMAVALKKIGEIDPEALLRSVAAITVVMGVLTAMMAVMNVISQSMKPGTLIAAAAAMVIMAGALYVVAGAVAIFGVMPLDVLQQGAISVGIAIAALVTAGILASKFASQMLQGSLGMIAMAVALNLLLVPLTALGLLPLDILIQGMTSILIMLGAMAVFGLAMGKSGPGMALGALGMIGMALAIQMMLPSIIALGMIDMAVLIQGLTGLAVALVILVAAAQSMTGAIVGAGAMVVMAFAITVLSTAIMGLGAIPFKALMAGLLGVALALGILIGAGYLAMGAAPGLIALSIAAIALGVGMVLLGVGLALFAPAAALAAGGIILLGKAAAEASPHILAMMGIGLGLILLGVGLGIVAAAAILLGVALMAMGVGMSMLAVAAIPGTEAIKHMVDELTKISLLDMGKMALVAVAFTTMGAGLTVLGIGALAAGVGILAFGVAWALFSVSLISLSGPVIAATGRLSASIPPHMTALTNAVVAASVAIPSALQQIRVAFLQMGIGVVQAISAASSAMSQAGSQMGQRLIEGLISTVPMVSKAAQMYVTLLVATLRSGVNPVKMAAVTLVKAAITSFAQGVPGVRTPGLALVTTYALAMLSRSAVITSATSGLVAAAIAGLNSGIRGAQSGAYSSGYAIGLALANGMRAGINAGSYGVRAAAASMAQQAARAARASLQIASPSKVTTEMGKFFSMGLANGILDNVGLVTKSADYAGQASIDHLRSAINQIGSAFENDFADLDPTIRPIVDLSDVESKARMMSDMLQPALSSTAQGASATIGSITTPEAENSPGGNIEVRFEQHNTSPKALPATEIYRRTKSGLSVLRDSLEKK